MEHSNNWEEPRRTNLCMHTGETIGNVFQELGLSPHLVLFSVFLVNE